MSDTLIAPPATLETLDARALVPAAPPDLPALCFHRRPPARPTARILAAGDLGLSGRMAEQARREGAGSLLAELAPVLRSGQIVMANLETPLVAGAPRGAMFAGSPDSAPALAAAGFTLLNLANNHITDYGAAGLQSTLTALAGAGIEVLGAGVDEAAARTLARTDAGGLRIGWLGCGRTLREQTTGGPVFWEFDEAALETAVREARPALDLLIVSIHIGYAYIDYPAPEHKALAERLMSAGADLVLMHHAHVLQGVEVTDAGRVACYNLGNFLFDWEEGNVRAEVAVREQHEAAVFVFDVDREGVALAAALPTRVDEAGRLHWATGADGRGVLDRLAAISRELGSDYGARFQQQRSERNTNLVFKVAWFHLRRGHWGVVLGMARSVRPRNVPMLIRWLGRRAQAPLQRLTGRRPGVKPGV